MTQMGNKCNEQDVIYIIKVSSQIYLLLRTLYLYLDLCLESVYFAIKK